MEAASKGTYLSKKQILAYTQKREQQNKKKQESKPEKILAKAQQESDVIQPKSSQQPEDAQQEGKKAEFGPSKQQIINEVLQGSDDSDDEKNRSMEDVDSDELDGDLNLSDNEEEAEQFRSALKVQKSS